MRDQSRAARHVNSRPPASRIPWVSSQLGNETRHVVTLTQTLAPGQLPAAAEAAHLWNGGILAGSPNQEISNPLGLSVASRSGQPEGIRW